MFAFLRTVQGIVSFQTDAATSVLASRYGLDRQADVFSPLLFIDVASAFLTSFVCLALVAVAGLTGSFRSETVTCAFAGSLFIVFAVPQSLAAACRISGFATLLTTSVIGVAVSRLLSVCILLFFQVSLPVLVTLIAVSEAAINMTFVLRASRHGLFRWEDLNARSVRRLGGENPRLWRMIVFGSLTTTIRYTAENADLLVAGLLLGLEQAALLRIAKSIYQIGLSIGWPLSSLVSPLVARTAYRESTRLVGIVGSVVTAGSVIGAACITGFLVLWPALIIMVGSRFEPAFTISLLYLTSAVMIPPGAFILPILYSRGKEAVYLAIHVVSFVVGVLAIVSFVGGHSLVAFGFAQMSYVACWLLIGSIVALSGARGVAKST